MFFLLSLSLGLGTALFFVYRALQESKRESLIAQQRLKEADLKYGGLLSREDAARDLDSEIKNLTADLSRLEIDTSNRRQKLSGEISALELRLKDLKEQDFFADFSFYESKYDFQQAQNYKQRLDEIRSYQKQKIKAGEAAVCNREWTVDGDAKKGQKMTDGFLRLVLRAFNGECDTAIAKVNYSNVQTMENRIKKAYSTLNKLSETTRCEIAPEYLELKLQELFLTHEFQEKKHQEREEQRLINEQIREEEKAQAELDKARKEAEQEESRRQKALDEVRKEAGRATGSERAALSKKIEDLQEQLAEAKAKTERAISQAQMTKAGHVYIISNIGSFGEGIYKIGMTRRKEPMDRVKELGDASVPFTFDVHAMISCSNAPELESQLHKRLEDRRLNKINRQKEFFRVSLEEIKTLVQEIDREIGICESDVSLTKLAEAAEYRQSLAQGRKHC